jgi:hypothetical protein
MSVRRVLAVLATVAMCATLGSLPSAPVHAADAEDWPICTTGGQQNCVVSQKLNGVDIDPTGDGYKPYVDLIGSGTVRYGVYRVVGPDSYGDVNPNDTYQLVVRTGAIRPRELYGNIRNVSFAVGGTAGAWTFSLTFKPTPVHWVGYGVGDTRQCHVGACGDDTWHASLNYPGFVTGYVTDLAESGLTATEIGERVGLIKAYNAQEENTFYDPDTNSLVVQLANPHLTNTSAVATGSYETFLPNAFLVGTMNVPDPSTLSSGTVMVVRSAGGAVSTAPFTLTHVAGGIRITITGITYSSPTYRIHPGPGKPRYVGVRKISAHKARVRFRAPLASSGGRVNWYQARCHRLGRTWHYARATTSPITVGNLPRRRVYCQVRAHNRLGYGAWSATAHS